MKYSVHKPDEGRHEVAPGAAVSSLAVLLEGCFEVLFPGRAPGMVALSRPGDFVLWVAGVPHSWRAPTAARMLTVRQMGDLNFYVAAEAYGYAEVAHTALMHLLTDQAGASGAESGGLPD